jgi:hypothetical protein
VSLSALAYHSYTIAAERTLVYGELTPRFMLRARELNIPQHPDYAPIQFAGDEAGDFLFVPKP